MNWSDAEVQALGDGGYLFAVSPGGEARFQPIAEIAAMAEAATAAAQPGDLGTMAYALTSSLVTPAEVAADFAELDARIAVLELAFGVA